MPSRFFDALATRWNRVEKALTMATLADDLHDVWVERDERPLTPHERDLLHNALRFSGVEAGEVGIPRADMEAIPLTTSRDDLMATFAKCRFSRLVVYGRDLDDIVGIVSVKALLRSAPDAPLADMITPAVLVPETMPLPKVLQTMKRTRAPLVVVTDEYGGTSGLLSLKDILQVLVGDIDDDMVAGGGVPVLSLGEGRYRILPTAPLNVVEEALGVTLTDDDTTVETFGGLVMARARRIPHKGDKIRLFSKLEVLVTAADGRKILGMDVRVL